MTPASHTDHPILFKALITYIGFASVLCLILAFAGLINTLLLAVYLTTDWEHTFVDWHYFFQLNLLAVVAAYFLAEVVEEVRKI